MSTILAIGIAAATGISLVWAAEHMKRTRTAPALEKVASHFGGHAAYGWSGACASGSIDGEPAHALYLPARREYLLFPKPASLVIFIPLNVPGAFTLINKSYPVISGLPFTGAPVVEAGNALFDNEFSIHSPYESFVKTNFKDGEKRQAVRRIFNMGVKWISFNGKSLSAGWEPFDPSGEIDGKTLDELKARFASLRKNLQPAAGAIEHTEESKVFTFLLAAVALFLATVALSYLLLRNF